MIFRQLRWWFRELFIPRSWRFKCTECEDTGWASYDDRFGTVTYHSFDRCRACRALKGEPAE